MIFARKIKEIADVASERRSKELRTALMGVYFDLASEIEEKIKTAAENGLYNISISMGDLYDKIKHIEERLIADGYSLNEIVFKLACMIQERFFECEFDAKIGEPTSIYIAWDKKPQKCAIGRTNGNKYR